MSWGVYLSQSNFVLSCLLRKLFQIFSSFPSPSPFLLHPLSLSPLRVRLGCECQLVWLCWQPREIVSTSISAALFTSVTFLAHQTPSCPVEAHGMWGNRLFPIYPKYSWLSCMLIQLIRILSLNYPLRLTSSRRSGLFGHCHQLSREYRKFCCYV